MQNTYMYHVDVCLSIFTSTNMVKGLLKKSFQISKTKKQYMTCMKFKTFIKHSSYFADPVFHIARCAPAGLFIKFKMSKPTFFSWFLSVRS